MYNKRETPFLLDCKIRATTTHSYIKQSTKKPKIFTTIIFENGTCKIYPLVFLPELTNFSLRDFHLSAHEKKTLIK